jgi:hypothetical protein
MRWIWARVGPRWFGVGQGPMHRRWDRVAAVVAFLALLVALVAVPVAVRIGLDTHDTRLQAAVEQAEYGYRTGAVLQEDAGLTAMPGGPGGSIAGPVTAPALWRTPSGEQREGRILVDSTLRAGDTVTVWLNADGNIIPPPATSSEITAAAVFAGIQALVLIELAVLAALWLVRRLIGWARLSSWEAEWAKVEPEWTHRDR